jgi:hypothetical protein
MEGDYLISRDDSKQRQTALFLRTLNSNWDQYFGPAVLACETRRQEKLRKAAELPENYLLTIRNYCLQVMERYCRNT